MLLGFPFVGRLWCAVCPFMIYGEVAQLLSLKALAASATRLAEGLGRALGRLDSLWRLCADFDCGRSCGT